MVVSEKRQALTNRQQQIYDFLKEKILNRGYGPTVREIGNHFSIRSPNGVMCHLKALERKGLILRESNMSRAIQLTDNSQRRTTLPLLGTAVSGNPWQSAAADQEVEFGGLFQPGNRACIHVVGTAFASMGIHDGDQVIVGKGMSGTPGSLLAGLDDRDCLMLTRVLNDGASPRPAVAGVATHTLGVVVGIVRRFSAADEKSWSATATALDDGADGKRVNCDEIRGDEIGSDRLPHHKSVG